MGYIQVDRLMNKEFILTNAMVVLRQKKLIDYDKYSIISYGIREKTETEGSKLIVTVLNLETNEEEEKEFLLCKDLQISPKTLYGFYIYRFNPTTLRLGDAIRVVQELDENGKPLGNYAHMSAFNAVIITANVKTITFVMVPSRGPMTRYLTARECYEQKITIFKYTEPDNYGYKDDNQLDTHVEEIK